MEQVVFLICFSLILGIVILYEWELLKKHKSSSKGVINHDFSRMEFCYKVEKSEAEIWEALAHYNISEVLRYRVDNEQRCITFYHELPVGCPHTSYDIYMKEYEEYTVLKVVQVAPWIVYNEYSMFQNRFWSQKLGAVPIPYVNKI